MNMKHHLLFCTLSALLLATTACNGGTGGGSAVVSSPSNSSGVAKSTAAISADDKPLDVMTRAMRAQLDAKSYRAHITSSTSKGTNNTMVIEYVAPDRYRMVSEAQSGSGKAYNMEYVIAGGGMYVKAPNGQFVKSPIDAGELIKMIHDPKMLDELAKTADVKFVGADTLDGAPMLVYQYTQTNPLDIKLKSTAKTWLAVSDGLPRKTEAEGEFAGMKTKTLITISDYNSDIKIESPVK